MATYRSNAAGAKFFPYDRPEGAALAQEFSLPITVTVTNADIYVLGKLPPGSTLLGFSVDFPILDTGTAVVQTSIGDATNAAKFFTSNTATFHNAATRVSSLLPINAVTVTTAKGSLAGSLPVSYTNATDIRATVTVAPNVGATSGTINGFYLYTMRPAFRQPDL